jgi:hypothetical protein
MTDHHDPQCPVMEIGCHSVGGYDVHHDRGRAGDCRCGKKCQCALIVRVRADQLARHETSPFLTEALRRERERLQARVEELLKRAKKERDAAIKYGMRDNPYGYGQNMWYGGRATGITEALQLLDGELDD